jgi:hypothetical protein
MPRPSAHSATRDSRSRTRRAFTFAELVIGMAITAVTLCAMACVMAAVSAGWKQQGITQGTYLNNRQAVVRVQNLLRSAKLIGLVREGSLSSNTSDAACVEFWRADDYNGSPDRAIQFSEIGLLIHDRSDNTLKFYSVNFPKTLTAAQVAALNPTCQYADLTGATAPETFKSLNYVTPQIVARNVTGATFYANQSLGQSSQLPTFEFQIVFARNGDTSQVYGSTALRNPDFRPAQ